MTLQTRQPSGKAPWPMLLIAGTEKAGKSWACAQASGSDVIGRTLWISVGEDDPDEYALVPGARFEIVVHDGTYRGILQAVTDAVAEPDVDGKPTLIVVDSMTRVWNLLSNMAQAEQNRRAQDKARRQGRAAPDGDQRIDMDLWNVAAGRHAYIVNTLREHDGPVLLTARLDRVTVMDAEGKPTKDKDDKVQGHKTLPYDVTGIIELPARGEAHFAGVKSVRMAAKSEARRKLPKDWTIPGLWEQMGVAAATTAPRQFEGAKHIDRPAAQDWVAEAQKATSAQAIRALWGMAKDDGATPEQLAAIVDIGRAVEAREKEAAAARAAAQETPTEAPGPETGEVTR